MSVVGKDSYDEPLGLDRTSVMLVVSGSSLGTDEATSIARKALREHPVCLSLCGASSDELFDAVLDEQQGVSGPHTMTKRIGETFPTDAIEDFLDCTWPSEERFSDWDDYGILFVGDGPIIREFERSAYSLVNDL